MTGARACTFLGLNPAAAVAAAAAAAKAASAAATAACDNCTAPGSPVHANKSTDECHPRGGTQPGPPLSTAPVNAAAASSA